MGFLLSRADSTMFIPDETVYMSSSKVFFCATSEHNLKLLFFEETCHCSISKYIRCCDKGSVAWR